MNMKHVVDTLHLLALVAWISMLAAAGGAAMAVFITLPTLGVRMDSAVVVLGADHDLHGRVVGGMVMRPVFALTDRVQAVAALIAVVTLLIQLTRDRTRWPIRRPANIIRSLAIVTAAGLVLLHAITAAPRMDDALLRSWAAIEAGDRVEWLAARAEFDADHHRADALFRLRLALVLLATGALAVGGVRSPSNREVAEAAA